MRGAWLADRRAAKAVWVRSHQSDARAQRFDHFTLAAHTQECALRFRALLHDLATGKEVGM